MSVKRKVVDLGELKEGKIKLDQITHITQNFIETISFTDKLRNSFQQIQALFR